MTLNSFNIDNTRAVNNDTDHIYLSATKFSDVNNMQPPSATPLLHVGDVNNGDHDIKRKNGNQDFQITMENLNPGDSLIFNYAIINAGDQQKARAFLDDISSKTKDALTQAYPAYAVVWTLLDALTQFLNHLDQCDGIILADQIAISSDELANLTNEAPGIIPQTRHFPGYDSQDGCGSNSDYKLSWTVTRLFPAPIQPIVY